MKKKYWFGLMLLLLLASCTTVKEYEKVYINDPDMKLSAVPTERF